MHALFLTTFKALNGKHYYVTHEETEQQKERCLSRAIRLVSGGAKICSLASLILNSPNFHIDFTVILVNNPNRLLPSIRLSLQESTGVEREPFLCNALN